SVVRIEVDICQRAKYIGHIPRNRRLCLNYPIEEVVIIKKIEGHVSPQEKKLPGACLTSGTWRGRGIRRKLRRLSPYGHKRVVLQILESIVTPGQIMVLSKRLRVEERRSDFE